MSDLELDCRAVQTLDQLAQWAIDSFGLPLELAELPRISVPGFFRSRSEPNMDRLTELLYHHIGKNRLCFSVHLRHAAEASPAIAAVLDHPHGWRRAFGSGLPHDYGVAVSFGA